MNMEKEKLKNYALELYERILKIDDRTKEIYNIFHEFFNLKNHQLTKQEIEKLKALSMEYNTLLKEKESLLPIADKIRITFFKQDEFWNR